MNICWYPIWDDCDVLFCNFNGNPMSDAGEKNSPPRASNRRAKCPSFSKTRYPFGVQHVTVLAYLMPGTRNLALAYLMPIIDTHDLYQVSCKCKKPGILRFRSMVSRKNRETESKKKSKKRDSQIGP